MTKLTTVYFDDRTSITSALGASRNSQAIGRYAGIMLLVAMAVGCDSAQQPAKPRPQLGVGASSPPPPPPPAPAVSVAVRPQAAAESESTSIEPTESPAVATASPAPAPAEPTIDAEQQALLDQADPKNWRTDYYAFLKNVQPGDGQFSWGEMKDFARWYKLQHAATDAMTEAMRARNRGNKKETNDFLRVKEEFRAATKKLGKVTWSARVVYNPRSDNSNTKVALPDLPAPAAITFWIPKDEVDRWNSVQEGDTVRFEGSFGAAGAEEHPNIMVYMHLLP